MYSYIYIYERTALLFKLKSNVQSFKTLTKVGAKMSKRAFFGTACI